ncbi:MAG TPA: septal ring lytic transglycosylase RlpA family protein [Chloroflexota bacterium]|nr:septal ring lytic transglycosylase RlpA family protein [Chloroflexota bacterium]
MRNLLKLLATLFLIALAVPPASASAAAPSVSSPVVAPSSSPARVGSNPSPVTSAPKPSVPPLDWAIPDGHFYTQANGFPLGTSPMGYAIVDDAPASFWTALQKYGGVNRLGYPVSQRFLWGGFITQATQKAVLQWRPEKHDVDFVNVFDELSKAGKDGWLQSVRSVPQPLASSFDRGLSWQHVIDHRVNLLRGYPALYARYVAASDPLDQYGLPTSPVVDEGPMYVVRLQRAVLQEWKVDRPWAHAGEVTVANGGDVGKEAGIFPWKTVRPVAPPDGSWSATPGDYALTGHATWYGPGFVGKAMANGQIYQPGDPTTTASNAYPLGSLVQVTSPRTNRTIKVVVRDTGRFPYPDVLDLSPAAFESLGGALGAGVIPVSVVLLSAGPGVTSSSTQAPPAR